MASVSRKIRRKMLFAGMNKRQRKQLQYEIRTDKRSSKAVKK